MGDNPDQRTSSEHAIDQQSTSEIETKIDVGEEASPSEHNANENKDRYFKVREWLYPAALEGDWQTAEDQSKKYPVAAEWELPREMGALQDKVTIWELPITLQKMNVLQVAIAAKQTNFVKKLLNCMSPKELEFKNGNEDTALAITALSGSVEIATKMVKKNPELLKIQNAQKLKPLIIAAMHRQRDMVSYLYHETKSDDLKNDEKMKLLSLVISCDLYDIAREILKNNTELPTAEEESWCIALEQLARKPFAIGSRSEMSAWERCIGYCFKGFYHKAVMRTFAHELVEDIWKKVSKSELKNSSKYYSTIFIAAELGNIEFLTILIRSEPDLIWIVDENNRNIFHISVLYRQESIFNLIHEVGIFKNLITISHDQEDNNMLHLAGKLAPPDRLNIVSGAALRMQRELLWFKEVEKIVPHPLLKEENSQGKTPKGLFTETHQTLQKDGEKWMRVTAMHCMLVATLIATVVFAATFTLPGGNDQGRGTPIFLERNWFLVFFIFNSIALISSSTSILVFLSILTSRYTEKDFLSSLPRRLMLGLTALFISIIGMVVAFGATCFLVYQRKVTRVPTVIITLAGVPISSFVLLHHELLADIIRSTYLSKFLFRSNKRLFRKKVESAHSNNWSVNRIVNAIKEILTK